MCSFTLKPIGRKVGLHWSSVRREKPSPSLRAGYCPDAARRPPKTWDLFFTYQPEPISFDIQHMAVVAGNDVAFAAAAMRCAEKGKNGEPISLDFRVTIGPRKTEGEWVIVHEHHSVPAT